MNQSQKTLIVISILLIASLSFVGPYLIQNLPFVYGGDLQPQWYFFYKEIQNLVSFSAILKDFRFPFYSWSIFLGNNFWASKAYYGLSDIFNYITLYLPIHFYSAFEIQIILKIVTAGLSFYFLAKDWKDDFVSNLTVSIAYALSAWMIYYIGQMTFVSFYAIFPLYVLGIELFYRKNHFYLYIISTALLILTNFYLFISLIFFSIIYTVFRYYTQHHNFKGYIKKTSILILYALIGVMMSAFIMYPTLLYMLGNDRLGEMKLFLNFEDFNIYLHQWIAGLIPSHLIIYQDNPFETGGHNTREILLWTGSLSALLVPQILFDQDPFFRKASRWLYLILLLIFTLPILNSLMHGLSQNSFRWLYFFILFNLFIAHRYLSSPEYINQKWLKRSLIILLSFMLMIYLLSISLDLGLAQINAYPKTTFAFLFSALGLIFVFILLTKNNKISKILLIVLTFTELTYAGYLNLVERRLDPNRTWEFENRVTHVLEDYPNELNVYLESLEPANPNEYYRVYIPHDSLYWSYSHNLSIAYQLQGLMTYDSSYAPSFNDLKAMTDEVKAFNSDWLFDIKEENLVNFLNVKYAIVVDKSELPHDNFRLMIDGYRGGLKIYRNDDYRPLGTLYLDITTTDQYTNELSLLLDTVIVDTDDYNEIANVLGTNTELIWNYINHYDNHLDASFITKDRGFMVLTLPYDLGWRIKINDQWVESFKVNGGFIGIPVESGENRLEMNFVPEGFKEGILLSGLGIFLFSILVIYQRIKKLN